MAAGLGFKTFTTGEVLTAADTNGYLMQGILVFANATARDAAITSPQEGQFAYLKDTNVTTYYTGSAWANVDTTGMTNPMTTTGDVIYSSSGSTPARLGIGTASQVLAVNSGATAPEWVTPAAGGGWTSLASGTLNTATGTLSLTSISGSYKNLRLIIRDAYGATDDNGLRLQVNSVTSYDFIRAGSQASGAAMGSEGLLGQTRFLLYFERNDNTNDENFFQIDFYDYANTTTYKFMDANQHYKQNTDSRSSVAWTKGISRDTAAISSITIDLVSGGNWGAAGTYVLYGDN